MDRGHFEFTKNMRKKAWLTLGILGLSGLMVGALSLRVLQDQPPTLPSSIVEQATFPPYFYKGTIPGDFRLRRDTVSYTRGVLIFKLVNKQGKEAVFTEQALPDQLRTSSIQGTEEVPGTPGKATISYGGSRIVGTLITKDRRTMIVVNAERTLETDTMGDLLRAMTALR